METKQQRERAFHNQAYGRRSRRTQMGLYEITDSSHRCFHALLERAAGKRVLEFGCGLATQAIGLAQGGAHVTAIDISDVAIERARAAAHSAGVGDRTEFLLMDAEALDFEDDSFDLVCGSAILHHLDLERTYGEIARTLAPGGTAVFLEPLGHNPLINLFRKGTPRMRTVDEHPLLMGDLDLARMWFETVEARFFHLQSLMAIPFRTRRCFPTLVRALDRADAVLFEHVPPVRKHAWMTVLRFAESSRAGSSSPPQARAGFSAFSPSTRAATT